MLDLLYDAWRRLRDGICFWRKIKILRDALAQTDAFVDKLYAERDELRTKVKDLQEQIYSAWIPEPNPNDAPLDKIELGNNAQRLLADPVLQLAFSLAEADLKAIWEQSSGQDSEGREAAYWGLRGLYAGKQKLRAILAAKKVIEAEAERKRKADEYKAERGIRELRVV